jgi:nicotinamidase-related amidase
MVQFTLSRKNTGLLIIDVQERLFTQIEHNCEILYKLLQVTEGFQILELPIVISEQYPQGLGSTIRPLKEILGEDQPYLAKTTFSCLGDEDLKKDILSRKVDSWVLSGIEAHVCVLQTAKQLLEAGKKVVVLNDAIGSRSIYDYSSSIAELRDCGARISTTETILFELLGNSKAAEFKEISRLIKCDSEKQFSCCQL